MKRTSVKQTGFWAMCFLFTSFLPLILNEYYIQLVTKMFILSLLALSFSLLLGYTGMLSFGQSAYYGLGAYACSLYLKKISASSIVLPIFGSVLVTSAAAFVIGIFCVRLTRVYFALLTLAFSQLVYAVIFKWYSFTGGDNGLVGIPVPELNLLGYFINLKQTNNYYYFTMILSFLAIIVCKFIMDSHFGSVLKAIRENPGRTEYLGIKVKRYQLMIFTFAGAIAGLGGALVGPFERSIFPDLAYWTTSGEAAFMSILGGIYNFTGPFIGAIILQILQNVIRSYTEFWAIIVGGILILIVIFLPGGVVGFLDTTYKKIRKKRRLYGVRHTRNQGPQ
jgi:branched-chain amino acid transport system permease protein